MHLTEEWSDHQKENGRFREKGEENTSKQKKHRNNAAKSTNESIEQISGGLDQTKDTWDHSMFLYISYRKIDKNKAYMKIKKWFFAKHQMKMIISCFRISRIRKDKY